MNIDGEDVPDPRQELMRAARKLGLWAAESPRAEAWRSLALACWEAEEMTARLQALGYPEDAHRFNIGDPAVVNRLRLACGAAVYFARIAVDRSLSR